MKKEDNLEELKQIIVDYATKSVKSKFYFKDIITGVKKVKAEALVSDIKKSASELVAEGILEYFSTGSTTMYGLKGKGISPTDSGI